MIKQMSYAKPSPRTHIPKKQDRMFHIELGQNDGPFKDGLEGHEAFDPAKVSGKLLEGPSLKEELNREQPENYDTVYNILKRIEEYSQKAVGDLMDYKEKEMNLRDEIIRDINDMVEKENSETLENLKPLIQKDYKELKQTLKGEKEENEQILKQLLKIRKDFSSLTLQINSCDGKASHLQSGILGEAEKMEENFDL
eukprot:TRINITY_DN12567_c0_g4_i1.p1 TRINITY_DN12567_c0_g4~~TRINITY_DN12567_c0_g4_i1.p1  ORF type:complete len:197 (-),score=87.44 TRINITY_DN12567_c0_g4_i1:44-634(-)